MKLLAFLIPFFLSSVVFGNDKELKLNCNKIPGFEWTLVVVNTNISKALGVSNVSKCLSVVATKGNATNTTRGLSSESTNNSANINDSQIMNKDICKGELTKGEGQWKEVQADSVRTQFCLISNYLISEIAKAVVKSSDMRNQLNKAYIKCTKEDKGKWEKKPDEITDEEINKHYYSKEIIDALCKDSGREKCEGVDGSGGKNAKLAEGDLGWYWGYEGGEWDCYKKQAKECKKLQNPQQDCAPETRETMTDLFIQGLGFVSAQSGNTCITLAVQSFPQTKAYNSAVSKCKKQTNEACKPMKNGEPQCETCARYKKELEHVKVQSAKMLAGYQEAVKCAQQTKTDYKGVAEECNVINAFNRDKCCFMPEHMNTPLCDDFGSEHAFSPNLGYTDKKRIGGGESIDYGGDELPFVHSPSKFDPKKDPILNSPLSPDSGSSIGGGGGAGGSPYTNSDSALGLSRKGAFQTYIQGGGGSRLGKSSSKNKSYPYALSSFERKKLKYKNKNNKKGKATIRSLASKRNRTIFEKISDVYTSLINKRKLFFKRDGAQK